MLSRLRYAPALAQACVSSQVTLAELRLHIPGSIRTRLSVVAGNMRLHRIIDACVRPDATVVDVGANIGYNAAYMARRVGRRGHVVAIEPAADNLTVLQDNVAANALEQITVHAVAAGRAEGTRAFFLRGDVSAVNSFFPESCYGPVTGIVQVPVARVDDLVEGQADLVKIDVEGGELDVLAGMSRLLRDPNIRLVVEWHPVLQEAAGYDADALPLFLMDLGFSLSAASHTTVTRLTRDDVAPLVRRLRRQQRPVELVAVRER